MLSRAEGEFTGVGSILCTYCFLGFGILRIFGLNVKIQIRHEGNNHFGKVGISGSNRKFISFFVECYLFNRANHARFSGCSLGTLRTLSSLVALIAFIALVTLVALVTFWTLRACSTILSRGTILTVGAILCFGNNFLAIGFDEFGGSIAPSHCPIETSVVSVLFVLCCAEGGSTTTLSIRSIRTICTICTICTS